MNNIRSLANHTPFLGAHVYIDPTALLIGDVTIGEDSSVWPMAVIRGDMHSIRIGARTNIQDHAILHITHASSFNPGGWPLNIGNEVTVGHHAILHGCTIKDRVLIGINAVIMDGAIIENEVLVGAGTLVPPGKILQSGYLYLGSPCKKARALTEQELGFFSYSASNYIKLKNQYLAACDASR